MNKGRIMAVDASTNSIAFAIFDGQILEKFGKIEYSGKNHYQKAGDACKKLTPLIKEFNVQNLVIESTIYANSPKTSMQLALNQGAIISAAYISGVKNTYPVAPIAWQNWIGNKVLTKAEKIAIRSDNPDKSASWYKNYERNLRKQRTIRLVNIEFMTEIDDNDVADAVGIGWYATNNWEKLGKFDF